MTALRAVTAIITRENQRRSWTIFLNKVEALLTLRQVLLPTYSVRCIASAVASLSHACMMIWYCGPYRHRRSAFIRFCRNQVAERYLPCVFASASCSLHSIGLLCIRLRGSCGSFRLPMSAAIQSSFRSQPPPGCYHLDGLTYSFPRLSRL